MAEIVAYKRDIKRRRMKYRTTKEPPLSRTEEVRRLIDTQMEALIQYLKPEEKEVAVPSCSKTSQMMKFVTSENVYSSSDGSSRRTLDYNLSQGMNSDYSSQHHKRSRSRSFSKSRQRKKSLSPAKNIYNRSDSGSHRTKNKRLRSRSRSHIGTSFSKSKQRKKSASPSKNTCNRSDSSSHRKN